MLYIERQINEQSQFASHFAAVAMAQCMFLHHMHTLDTRCVTYPLLLYSTYTHRTYDLNLRSKRKAMLTFKYQTSRSLF